MRECSPVKFPLSHWERGRVRAYCPLSSRERARVRAYRFARAFGGNSILQRPVAKLARQSAAHVENADREPSAILPQPAAKFGAPIEAIEAELQSELDRFPKEGTS
jgi:hypothetical protein